MRRHVLLYVFTKFEIRETDSLINRITLKVDGCIINRAIDTNLNIAAAKCAFSVCLSMQYETLFRDGDNTAGGLSNVFI